MFNNLGLALGTKLKSYTSVAKGLKLKVRKFWGLIPTFVEVTGEKLVKKPPLPLPTPPHTHTHIHTHTLTRVNFTDKLDLRRGKNSIVLSNLSIYYTWKT